MISFSSNGMFWVVNGDLWINGMEYNISGFMFGWNYVIVIYDGVVVWVYYNVSEVYFVLQVEIWIWISDIWFGQEQDVLNDDLDVDQVFFGILDLVSYYGYVVLILQVEQDFFVGIILIWFYCEFCDNQDNDCNLVIVDLLGQFCDGVDSDQCFNGVYFCSVGGFLWICGVESLINIVEVCNYLDDDCDGQMDDGFGVVDLCDGMDLDQCFGGWLMCGFGGGMVCGMELVLFWDFEDFGF